MIFKIGSLYMEPGYDFLIYYKVDTYIMRKINEMVLTPYGLGEDESDEIIVLQVRTTSKTEILEVMKPIYSKKYRVETWGVLFPYKEIAKAQDQYVPYLKHLFDAIVIILKNYNVKEEDIRKVQAEVEKEVLNNPEYEYRETE